MDNSPSFVYSCWNLTSLFKFWKVKLVVNIHVVIMEGTNWESPVYPAKKTSFVSHCPKLYSQSVGDMVTLAGRGPAHIFYPYINCLWMWLRVHVWAVRASERNWEPGGDDDSGPGWPPWSHPALLTVSRVTTLVTPGTAHCLRGVTESRNSQCFIDPQFYQKWINWTPSFKFF